MRFRLSFRGRCLAVDVKSAEATYALESGDALDVVHHGDTVEVRPGAAVTRPIPPLPRRDRPRQPPGRAPRRRMPDRPGPARPDG